jgi:GT2 family glycosyltransferase
VISVVVVNRDGERWLERCLGSLGEPRPQVVDVVVVDNCSSDGSVELVRRRFPHVRLLENRRNLGFGAANNQAAAHARGEALLLLNNDAWLEPGCLERLRARLECDPELGLVAPRLVGPDGRPRFVWSPDRSLLGEAVQRLRNPFEGASFNHGTIERVLRALSGPGWYTAACVLIRRRAFDDVGGFDPKFFLYFEDTDLCIRLREKGWRLEWEPDAVAVHAGGGRRLGDALTTEYRRSQLYYYRKHRPRWELAALKLMLVRRHGGAEVREWLDTNAGRGRSGGADGEPP